MSEQYRCKSCGYVFDMKDMMCSECGVGYLERLRWTKGGDGSHFEGCEDVHLDCRIAQLEKENARLTAELAELRERTRWIPVSERLPKRDGFYLVLENVNQVAGYYHWCKQFGWNTDGGRINIQSVTHWMPLPEPPEEIK